MHGVLGEHFGVMFIGMYEWARVFSAIILSQQRFFSVLVHRLLLFYRLTRGLSLAVSHIAIERGNMNDHTSFSLTSIHPI